MPTRFRGLTILLLEDEPIIALGLEDTLAEAGATVLTAKTCDEAKLMLNTKPIQMAALDFKIGEETCEGVAEICRAKSIPFVVTSGVNSEGNDIGAARWLIKPFPNCDLLDALAEVIPKKLLP